MEFKNFIFGYRDGRRDFRNCDFSGLSVVDCCRGFSYGKFPGCDFRGSDFSRSSFWNTDFSGCDFRGCRVDWCSGHRVNLSGCDLSGANLSRADLIMANLTMANLSRANLTSANLSRANLLQADLTGADLTNADLAGCGLLGTDIFTAKGLVDLGTAVQNLDRARDCVLARPDTLDMDHWHSDCGTAHCLAGLLEHADTSGRDWSHTSVAGSHLAPIAAPLFFESKDRVLRYLANREYAQWSQ